MREQIFDDIYIQPAAGDAGGAIGSALIAWYQYCDNERKTDGKTDYMQTSRPEFSNDNIKVFLEKNSYAYVELNDQELPEVIADLIANQKVIGWFQGRMEFGPRALGSRTIIGDAQSPDTQKIINLKINLEKVFVLLFHQSERKIYLIILI